MTTYWLELSEKRLCSFRGDPASRWCSRSKLADGPKRRQEESESIQSNRQLTVALWWRIYTSGVDRKILKQGEEGWDDGAAPRDLMLA